MLFNSEENTTRLVRQTYHYGNQRSVKTLTFSEFLKELGMIQAAYNVEGRARAIEECLTDFFKTGRGEFGWTTYELMDFGNEVPVTVDAK